MKLVVITFWKSVVKLTGTHGNNVSIRIFEGEGRRSLSQRTIPSFLIYNGVCPRPPSVRTDLFNFYTAVTEIILLQKHARMHQNPFFWKVKHQNFAAVGASSPYSNFIMWLLTKLTLALPHGIPFRAVPTPATPHRDMDYATAAF